MEVFIKQGDVIRNGGVEYYIYRVSESGATGKPLITQPVVFNARRFNRKEGTITEAEVSISRAGSGKPETFSARIELGYIVRRLTPEEFKTLITDKISAAAKRKGVTDSIAQASPPSEFPPVPQIRMITNSPGNQTQQTGREETIDDSMKNKTRSNKSRKATKASDNTHYDKVMDQPLCAVVRKLGLEGVTQSHAAAILKTYGIVMPPRSLNVQLYLGRDKVRPAAELTKAQVAELKKRAADPGPAKVKTEAKAEGAAKKLNAKRTAKAVKRAAKASSKPKKPSAATLAKVAAKGDAAATASEPATPPVPPAPPVPAPPTEEKQPELTDAPGAQS